MLTAALLAVGIAWACRRLGLGPAGAFGASVTGWLGFVAVAFLGDTLTGGLAPTAHTLRAAIALWAHGAERVRLRPSPAVAEPGLRLLSATGFESPRRHSLWPAETLNYLRGTSPGGSQGAHAAV
ncbi:MAG: hypothetical protein ACRDYX_19850 [Egibacteraceae bacterium]